MKKLIFLAVALTISFNLMSQTEGTGKDISTDPKRNPKAQQTTQSGTSTKQITSDVGESPKEVTPKSVAAAKQLIELPQPSKSRKCDIMQALGNRKSTRNMKAEHVSLQDLSDILWAAKGVNRPDENKMTSPTARNSQEIEVYLCRPEGVYIYLNEKNALELVSDKNIFKELNGTRPTGALDILLIVADLSRYNGYSPNGDNTHFYEMGAVDAGIVSQNISLMCAAANIGTVPRAMMDHENIYKILDFGKNQVLWLNHPIGYFEK
ncbi:MAG: nitroreductase family protein [Bacteroidales bacterium]|jgi:hypothetical protein|nr:nitroreductase family protein [Bacteroidales bacterium]